MTTNTYRIGMGAALGAALGMAIFNTIKIDLIISREKQKVSCKEVSDSRVADKPTPIIPSRLDRYVTWAFKDYDGAKFPAKMERLKPLLVAMWSAESSFRVDAVGHDGELGPLQGLEDWWLDGCHQGGAGWDYQDDIRDFGKSCWVAYWYWIRYCPDAVESNDWETLARIHNGGPRGDNKQATLKYWERVQEKLEDIGGAVPVLEPLPLAKMESGRT